MRYYWWHTGARLKKLSIGLLIWYYILFYNTIYSTISRHYIGTYIMYKSISYYSIHFFYGFTIFLLFYMYIIYRYLRMYIYIGIIIVVFVCTRINAPVVNDSIDYDNYRSVYLRYLHIYIFIRTSLVLLYHSW